MPEAFVPLLARTLIDFVWQGALIGLLAWLVLMLVRNARPQLRYAVACLALLACALLPIVRFALAIVAAGDAPMPAGTPAMAIPDAAFAAQALHTGAVFALPTPPPASMAWLVALWASGAGLLSLRMLGGALWLRRVCREARSEAGAWQARVDALARRLGVRRAVALRLTADGDGPATTGWWRPVILLPAAVAMHLPADLLEALLAHELAHVRRHDYLINLLQRLVETLLFYHPVVWWLSHRIRIERELVADDLAATALGDRRRLAVALATLDRLAAAPRSPFPLPAFAQAAHGGHLMSRIQQLVRPSRRAIGGAVLPPLLGLAVAAGAFYAHAHLAPKPITGQTPPRATSPDPTPKPQRIARADDRRDGIAYALVRKGEDGMTMSGSHDDRDNADIEAARRDIDGDFLWFRRDGKAYVVRDAATLAQADAAWAKTRELSAQMDTLSARMQPHQEKMQALGARMQALQVEVVQPPEMEAARVEMERLSGRMQVLSTRMSTLGADMGTSDDAGRDRLQAQMDALSAEQETLGREMERQGEIMEAAGERIEARTAPMEALGHQMEDAGKPMETIGKEMEAVGARIERSAADAEARTRRLIDDAFAKGLAMPAPTRQ